LFLDKKYIVKQESVMLNSRKEIFAELDHILDQLAQSASILKECNPSLCSSEITLLKQTQESLAARLIHTKHYLEIEPCYNAKDREKKEHLERKMASLRNQIPFLTESFSEALPKNPCLGTRPRIGRNRKKLKVCELAYSDF
jgi:hypothetical protein